MATNTTGSVVEQFPRRAPDPPHGHVNTSRVVEEDLEYTDSNEVLHIVSASGWCATFKDGREEPLVGWAVLENDRAHGFIVAGRSGGPVIDASADVSKEPGFTGYKYIGG